MGVLPGMSNKHNMSVNYTVIKLGMYWMSSSGSNWPDIRHWTEYYYEV